MKAKEVYNYKCTLVKVVDGDTIDIDLDLGFDVWLRNQRVRLYGIDTPESRTRNKAEKVLGLFYSCPYLGFFTAIVFYGVARLNHKLTNI